MVVTAMQRRLGNTAIQRSLYVNPVKLLAHVLDTEPTYFFPKPYAKTRLLNVFVTTDWAFAGFSQSLPLFEPESAFFTFSRDYH